MTLTVRESHELWRIVIPEGRVQPGLASCSASVDHVFQQRNGVDWRCDNRNRTDVRIEVSQIFFRDCRKFWHPLRRGLSDVGDERLLCARHRNEARRTRLTIEAVTRVTAVSLLEQLFPAFGVAGRCSRARLGRWLRLR